MIGRTCSKPVVTLAALLAISLAALSAGCLGADVRSSTGGNSAAPSAAGSPAQTATVTLQNFAFNPKLQTIAKGGTITFVNADSTAHTVTPDAASEFTGIANLAAGQSGTITFPATGTFPYYCQYHGKPGGVGMAGTLTVQ